MENRRPLIKAGFWIKKNKIKSLIFGLIIWIFLVFAGHLCFFGGFEGRVTDGETGKPIEGAIVAAKWPLQSSHGFEFSMLEVVEVETDQNGVFKLPPWLFKLHFGRGALDYTSPAIVIYKNAYAPNIFYNNYNSFPLGWPFLLTMKVEESDLVLFRYKHLKEKENSLSYMNSWLSFALLGRNCEWLDTKKILKAYFILGRELRSEGLDVPYSGETILDISCGDPYKFLKI